MPELALEGIRVVDLTQGIGGPYCTKLLADLGAEVIKVEPPDGDYARRFGPFPNDVPHHDRGGLFLHLNSNKKSVTLDVGTESGRVILRKLLAKADVLVEDSPPGQMAAMGLGYEDVRGDFPRLVHCSITPFGQSGPYSGFRGNSLTSMALSGLMHLTGDPDKEPLSTGGEPAEYFAGLQAWVGVLAALEHRAKTGAGQHVDVSMLESLGCADEYNTAMYSYFGAIRKRSYPRHHLPIYPSEIFPCRNGYVTVIGGSTGFPLMIAVLIERPEMESDPLFQNLWLRTLKWKDFEAIIQPWLSEHDWEDILSQAQELHVPFAAVLDAKTLLENEHLQDRGFFKNVDHPELGTISVAAFPFRMSETQPRVGRSPLLGEHNAGVLAGLGYDAEDALVLRERGVA